MKRDQIQKPTLQIVSVPQRGQKDRTNGKANGEVKVGLGGNSRTFETRFISRYNKMVDMPEGLPQPHFSQSANRILKERYLLKGGNLEAIETVAERFWHIAFDIASADFDFGATEKQVIDVAKAF